MPDDSNGYAVPRTTLSSTPSTVPISPQRQDTATTPVIAQDKDSLNNAIQPPILFEEEPQISHINGIEARDYMNGGLPHEVWQPFPP